MLFRKIFQAVIHHIYRRIGPDRIFPILMGKEGLFVRSLYIRLRGDVVRFRSKYGFVMEVSPYEHWMSGYMFLGETNPWETAFVRGYLRKGDMMIDVGAHNGWYSLVASQRVGKAGRVLSFEPNLSCIRVLERNIILNNYANISVVQAALSDHMGVATLWIGDDMGGSLIKDQADHVSKGALVSHTVRTYTLDGYLQKKKIPSPIRLIKVDVEGAELEVLSGARKTLRRYTPVILAEVYCKDKKQQQKRDTLFAYLQSLGYVPFLLTANGLKKTKYKTVSRDTINLVLQHHA